nr:hypothetical protein [Janthinobacterium lividum]
MQQRFFCDHGGIVPEQARRQAALPGQRVDHRRHVAAHQRLQARGAVQARPCRAFVFQQEAQRRAIGAGQETHAPGGEGEAPAAGGRCRQHGHEQGVEVQLGPGRRQRLGMGAGKTQGKQGQRRLQLRAVEEGIERGARGDDGVGDGQRRAVRGQLALEQLGQGADQAMVRARGLQGQGHGHRFFVACAYK